MKAARLAWLRFFALLFLLPGLAGLVLSAAISMHDLDTMPRVPALEQSRIIPRGIEGAVVYQSPDENRQFNLVEYSSFGVFVVGLAMGLVYMEERGGLQHIEDFEDSALAYHPSWRPSQKHLRRSKPCPRAKAPAFMRLLRHD